MERRQRHSPLTSLLLDTHVLVWLFEGLSRLGDQARQMTANHFSANRVMVSAISFWEIAMLAQRGKILDRVDTAAWRETVLSIGLVEIPMTGRIGVAAAHLFDFHPDPADRIIVATALSENAPLLTADRKILAWSGHLATFDATT
ncbi:type II toxin-antitoxin system VapC family toxin [Skermanella stibiiresistens]|uniref:type II toxin-antitoxin system VapC family toxin n=1 Tax=Skermanella stibiiresistens TaxID=913326 RepID=UPI0006864AA0|nr:type II toxin-antitoxin system VapC family toxin [Skermanella stibiiresistens]